MISIDWLTVRAILTFVLAVIFGITLGAADEIFEIGPASNNTYNWPWEGPNVTLDKIIGTHNAMPIQQAWATVWFMIVVEFITLALIWMI